MHAWTERGWRQSKFAHARDVTQAVATRRLRRHNGHEHVQASSSLRRKFTLKKEEGNVFFNETKTTTKESAPAVPDVVTKSLVKEPYTTYETYEAVRDVVAKSLKKEHYTTRPRKYYLQKETSITNTATKEGATEHETFVTRTTTKQSTTLRDHYEILL